MSVIISLSGTSLANWEMRSSRNSKFRVEIPPASLANWEMRSSRNFEDRVKWVEESLANWEMRSGRNSAVRHTRRFQRLICQRQSMCQNAAQENHLNENHFHI